MIPLWASHVPPEPMDPDRWERIQALFHDAAGHPAAVWRAHLEAACPDSPELVDEVLSLLEEDARRTSLLDREVARVASDLVDRPGPAPFDSSQFHPYRLKALLGEGGMGVVYLAERPDLGSLVAIKILRDGWLSPARRRRFTAEQRTLAQLNHPGIARLYDAHTLADGTPWFVMEYVDGIPLTSFCTARRSSIEERLRLFQSVCDAVQYAHERGIVHRDLKPSNILVKPDATVRLLDFGIATQLDRSAGTHGQTTVRLMTPAYAAPEQIRGEPVGVHTDVYSLGVMLYELLTGRLPFDGPRDGDAGAVPPDSGHPVRPSVAARGVAAPGLRGASIDTAAWADLDVLCLTAMHADPERRYQSADAIVRDLGHFLSGQPLDARPDGLRYRLHKFVRRNWRALAASLAALVLVGGLALVAGLVVSPLLFRGDASSSVGRATVAVLPFLNADADTSLDYLRVALPEELATTLSYSRSLSVRPVAATSHYDQPDRDLVAIGRRIGVSAIVSGRFNRTRDAIRVELEAVDVETGGTLWRDSFTAPAGNMVALQQEVAAKTHGGLAAAVGASELAPVTATRPRNEDAYELYLRSAGGRYDPGPRNTAAIAMLERAVALDPSYAPAWLALSRRYYVEARYATGNERLLQAAVVANQRALDLDPNFITARARLTSIHVELGDLVKAYREAEELIRRRPDSPDVHYTLSYVLRFAGLLDEASRECEIALSLDPHNWGWRSCAVIPLARGDYDGAQGYIQLDPGGEWARALTIHGLVSVGREAEALTLGRPDMPQWRSYDLLLACVARRPESQIAALTASLPLDADPETSYYSAAHLAYCGQDRAAVARLQHAIDGSYCSYPAIDTDPYFARLRGTPEFARVREAGVACQRAFLAQRVAGSE